MPRSIDSYLLVIRRIRPHRPDTRLRGAMRGSVRGNVGESSPGIGSNGAIDGQTTGVVID